MPALSFDTLVVEAKGRQPVRERRVRHEIHDLGSELERPEAVEREEAGPGVVRLHPQDAVELGGMPDRLVDLERELRAFEDDIGLAVRTGVRAQESDRFLADPGRVLHPGDGLDELEPKGLVVAVTLGKAPSLNFTVRHRGRAVAAPGSGGRLVDLRALRAEVELALADEGEKALGDRDSLHAAERFVHPKEQVELSLERYGERIDGTGRAPRSAARRLGGEDDGVASNGSARTRERDGVGRAGFRALAREHVGARVAPGAPVEDADSDPPRLRAIDAAHLPVLDLEVFPIGFEEANVREFGAPGDGGIEGELGEILHLGRRRPAV